MSFSQQRATERIRVTGTVLYRSAVHIGSGRPGQTSTDRGVLLGADGAPLLPGSSLKGKFRATVEALAPSAGLSACCLQTGLSGVECLSDAEIGRSKRDEFRNQKPTDRPDWVHRQLCDVCRLFGSQFNGGRIFFGDATLKEWSGVIEVRDGVCLDRDSGTARPKLKYDLEAIPAGTSYSVAIQLEGPSPRELALVELGLADWDYGFKIGGCTSRGFGDAVLQDVRIEGVRFDDAAERNNYLLRRTWAERGRAFTQLALSTVLEGGEGART